MIKTTFGDDFLSRLTAQVNGAFKGGRQSITDKSSSFSFCKTIDTSRNDDIATKKLWKRLLLHCFVQSSLFRAFAPTRLNEFEKLCQTTVYELIPYLQTYSSKYYIIYIFAENTVGHIFGTYYILIISIIIQSSDVVCKYGVCVCARIHELADDTRSKPAANEDYIRVYNIIS